MTHPFSVYLFLLLQTYLLAYLETVETFAINTDDGTLADKSGRIYLVDKTEYLLRLTLTRQYKQHVDILATVTAMTIHHRTTSVGSGIDGCTELQIFVADVWKFAAIQFIYGLFLAGAVPNINADLTVVTDRATRGKAFGLSTSANQFGGVVGPVLGGALGAVMATRYVLVFIGCILMAMGAYSYLTRAKQRM